MDKILELEKKLKEYREHLDKAWLGGTETSAQSGGVTQGEAGSGSGESIADQIDFGKEEKSGDAKKAEKDHKDEKEDKELIAEAMDEHNENKHGEKKDKDSAYKDADVEKNVNRAYSDQRGATYGNSGMVKFAKNGQWSVEKVAPEGVSEEKYDNCVEEVKEEGDGKNAYAICSDSLQDKKDKD